MRLSGLRACRGITFRKYPRWDAAQVRFKVPERPSRLDPVADKLSEWLRVEAGTGRKGRRAGCGESKWT